MTVLFRIVLGVEECRCYLGLCLVLKSDVLFRIVFLAERTESHYEG